MMYIERKYVSTGRVDAPAYSFSYPSRDLRPGIEPTNKIIQKMSPKNIIRGTQKDLQDISTSAALHWLDEQRNIAAHYIRSQYEIN